MRERNDKITGVVKMGSGGDDTRYNDGGDQGLGEEKKKSKALKSALFKTDGGIMGEELDEDDITKRRTLYGN